MHEELSGMKGRSEREIQNLKENLRLAMAALQEGQMLGNSLDHWHSANGTNGHTDGYGHALAVYIDVPYRKISAFYFLIIICKADMVAWIPKIVLPKQVGV